MDHTRTCFGLHQAARLRARMCNNGQHLEVWTTNDRNGNLDGPDADRNRGAEPKIRSVRGLAYTADVIHSKSPQYICRIHHCSQQVISM